MENTPARLPNPDFKQLFQVLPGLYVILSPDLTVLAASDAYLQATHSSREALVNRSLFDVFPENPDLQRTKARESIEASLNQVITHKTPQQLPSHRYDVLNKEGQYESRYWQLNSFPVLDDEGELQYIVHEVRDVTRQTLAEREKNETNERFERVAMATSDVIWDWNLLDDGLWWNEGYKTLFGYPEEKRDPTIASWTNFIHPDDLGRVEASIYKAIKNGQQKWQDQYRFRCADGGYKLVFDQGYLIYNEQNEAVRMLGAMVDITERHQVQQELKESTERFERVALATNDVIWDWNIQTNGHWVNEGFKKLFGYKDEDITPTLDTCTSRIHPDDAARVEASAMQALQDDNQELWEQEYRFRCADGSYKFIHDNGYIIRDEQNKPVRMIGAMRDVTAIRQLTEQQQESTARITQILESLPLMTWTAAPDGDVFYYSQRWFDFSGSTFEDLRAWGWSTIIHPDDVAATSRAWRHSLQTGDTFVAENRWRATDGSYRWFLARAVPIRNAAGEIIMWVGSHTDIEHQKQMMLALEESNAKFEMLAESIPHVVWSADANGHVDYFNQQWYSYTRMTEEETLGFGWAPALHPDDREPTTSDWLASMATGEKYERELRLRNIFTEDYRWFLARAVPARNADGEIIKWFGTATYIHDQKMLREQVEKSEKQFRFLAESIPQIIWTTRPDGYTEYFNKRWHEYTGLHMEESQGDVWSTLLHPEDRERAVERFQYSLRTGEYYEIEYRIKNGYNGTYRWFLGQAMPMRNAEGEIVKWFGTCTDIEDHKRAEEQLVEKNLELERINQDLDSFVYTASHDLKLPIVNMAGIYQELIRVATFNDPDAPKMQAMFEKALRQIHTTIQDLSDVVKVQRIQADHMELVDLRTLTEDVQLGLQDLLQETNARLNLDFAEAPALPFTKSSLKSIIFNLISNALKYRAPDRAPEVSLRTQPKGDYIELTVKDNGLGIDMSKHQNKLFQMFKRFHNHVNGSGLGLYIVNRLLTNHGGYINIESKLGEGTTFYLYFKQKKN
ncbi:PAS domain-containing sensor histidine kinase [Pontibacter sp. CAU 1760]